MTKSEILDDLEYVKSMAEEGRAAPLMGGRIGLMWGVLLAITFFGHWVVLSGKAGLSEPTLGYLWLAFAVIGGIGSAVLGRSIQDKPGITSVGNRVESAVWLSFMLMMGACFFGVVGNMLFSGGTPALFDMMVCIGFAGQIVAYLVIATMSGQKSLRAPAIMAAFATIGCFTLLGRPELYLGATVAIVLTVVLPSLSQMRKEPKAVV